MAVEATKKGPKLRTKTGCLTCRNRRKKCDEQYPLCGRCSSSRRECIWPSRDALLDKRHGARSGKNSPERNGALSRETSLDETTVEEDVPKPDPPSQDALVLLQSESLSKELLRLEIEPVVYHHFVDTYYGLIINPESHFDFYDDWINDLRTLMKESKALNYAVLSNAASHLSIVDGSDGMQELSLNFYTRSIRGLADSLQTGPQDHNAILMSVMLLYLHGHLGQGTWQDIPFHLRAATRIIKLRFLHDPKFVITKPFERLAIESVLFQVFLVTTGHWSKSWKRHEYDFDVKFWLDCESLLTRSTMFPGRSTSCNSPVLGIPIPLFKLNLTIKRVCDHLKLCTPETLAHLKQDVSYWEAAIALGQERSTQQRSLCDDATFLYILIASLLVEQLEEYSRTGGPPPPLPTAGSKWQMQGIFGILKRRHNEEGWHRTFVANWPVYTVGIFISTEEDKAFLRETIERRWARSSIYMMKRYSQDLERFWSGDSTPLSLSRESSTGSGSDISEI